MSSADTEQNSGSTQVVVIAGGRARRMGIDTPKCLLDIGGKTLIEKCLESLSHQGFSDFVLLLGHNHQMVTSFLSRRGLKQGIKFSIDPPSTDGWGKGKAFKFALENCTINASKRSIVVFPDDLILDHSFHVKLLSSHGKAVQRHRVAASIGLVSTIQVPYGIANVGPDGIVKKFEEKPMVNLAASIGVYVFEPEVYDIVNKFISLDDPSAVDLESVVLPKLVNQGKLSAMFLPADQWLPINTVKEYEAARRIIASENE